MSNFRKWLLAGAAGAALLCGLSFLSGETPQPPSSPLKASFNKAACDIRRIGSEANDRRLCKIMDIAAQSPTCRRMLERNPLGEWRIALHTTLWDSLTIAGYVRPGFKLIVLNPWLPDRFLVTTFIHELAHIDQQRLGISSSRYTAKDNILAIKLREASSFSLETQGAWELRDKVPGIWRIYSLMSSFASVWEQAVAEKPENATNGVALARTFNAFFSDSLSTGYEQQQAEREAEDALQRRRPFCHYIDEPLPLQETIASLSLHGIASLPELVKGFDLSKPRYAGCHPGTVKSLHDAGVPSSGLPPLRPDAPPSTTDDLLFYSALAMTLGFAPIAWQLGRLGHAYYKYRKALALRDSLNPKPR